MINVADYRNTLAQSFPPNRGIESADHAAFVEFLLQGFGGILAPNDEAGITRQIGRANVKERTDMLGWLAKQDGLTDIVQAREDRQF